MSSEPLSPTPFRAAAGMRSFAAVIVVSLGLSATCWGATFTVNNTGDAVDANIGNGICATAAGVCTLRAAIQEANASAAADMINLPAGTYTLTRTGRNEDNAVTGDLDITRPLTITGAGATSTYINAGGIDRVFDIYDTASPTTISSVTIYGGNPAGSFQNFGGGIWTSATLTLSNV